MTFEKYKPNKLIIINEVIDKLNQGISTDIIISEFCTKFHFTERTAFNYIKAAKNELFKLDQQIKKKKEKIIEEKAIESLEKFIINTDQRKEILSNIAIGELIIKKPFLLNGKIVQVDSQPDYSDRRNAIAELNKMEGDYSPTKIMQINANFEVLNIDPLSEIQNDTTNNSNS